MKKLLTLLSAVLILSAFTGCVGAEQAQSTVPPTQPPAVEIPFEVPETELPYTGVELDFRTTMAAEDTGAEAVLQAAEYFEKTTGAKIRIIWGTEDLTADSHGDIVQTPAEKIPDDAMDLTELAAGTDYGMHSWPVLRQQVINRKGCLAGIPYVPHLEGLYFNREVFESCGIMEVPVSWEAFTAVCQKLASAGYAMALSHEGGAQALQLHLESTLGETLPAGLAGNEQAVQSLQQLVDFAGSGFVRLDEEAACLRRMGLSNGALILGETELCRTVQEETLTAISWGVMPWPGSCVRADCDVLSVRSSCENPQAAFDFIILLTTGEFDQLRSDITGGIPADQANESSIAGAAELLAAAQPGKTDSRRYEALAMELWSGKYTNGGDFAAAVEQQWGN